MNYKVSQPPRQLRKARLDNISLVPASLLPLKNKYQPLANQLPNGSILCVSNSQRHTRIMEKLTTIFRTMGRQVTTLPAERVIYG